MKKHYMLFFCLCLFLGCSKNAENISLGDIDAHRRYQDKYGPSEVKYKEILEANPKSEHAFNLFARCENSEERSLQL